MEDILITGLSANPIHHCALALSMIKYYDQQLEGYARLFPDWAEGPNVHLLEFLRRLYGRRPNKENPPNGLVFVPLFDILERPGVVSPVDLNNILVQHAGFAHAYSTRVYSLKVLFEQSFCRRDAERCEIIRRSPKGLSACTIGAGSSRHHDLEVAAAVLSDQFGRGDDWPAMVNYVVMNNLLAAAAPDTSVVLECKAEYIHEAEPEEVEITFQRIFGIKPDLSKKWLSAEEAGLIYQG